MLLLLLLSEHIIKSWMDGVGRFVSWGIGGAIAITTHSVR
jgi:hypothetical protein